MRDAQRLMQASRCFSSDVSDSWKFDDLLRPPQKVTKVLQVVTVDERV